MAHEIGMTNGRHSMAYVASEGAPWHGLGTAVEGAMAWHEAIEAGGLDWSVDRVRLQTADGTRVADRVALVRSDTGAVLSTVGTRYQPIQNRTAFGLFDSLAAEGQVKYHTVGALGEGQTIWLLAKLPTSIVVRGVDVTDKYLLLTNTHTNKRSLRVFWTPIRVVCQNTLNRAISGANGGGVTIRHRGDVAQAMRDAEGVLGLANRYFDDFEGQVDRLASYTPTRGQLDAYFRALYPDPEPREDDREAKKGRAESTRLELFRLFEHGLGNDMPQVRHTAWAAYNAVTEFVDHRRGRSETKLRGVRERADAALHSAWLGSGASLKHKAFAGALELAGVN